MIKKIGEKKKTEVYRFDKQSPADLYTFAGEMVFGYPHELTEAIERIQESMERPGTEPGLTVHERILKMFEDEAKATLIENDYPVDIFDLFYIDENTMGIPCASARAVVVLANRVREDIKDNDTVAVFIDLFKLISASIRTRLNPLIVGGLHHREIHAKNLTSAKKERKSTRTVKKHQRVIEIAKELRAKFPALSKRNIAGRVFSQCQEEKIKYSLPYIRELIKPVLSDS